MRKRCLGMQDKEPKSAINMAAPNGIILALIGLLVLITPLTTEVHGSRLTMDIVAGAALVIGGGISLAVGLKRKR